jgi:hypothetical protein
MLAPANCGDKRPRRPRLFDIEHSTPPACGHLACEAPSSLWAAARARRFWQRLACANSRRVAKPVAHEPTDPGTTSSIIPEFALSHKSVPWPTFPGLFGRPFPIPLQPLRSIQRLSPIPWLAWICALKGSAEARRAAGWPPAAPGWPRGQFHLTPCGERGL